MTTLVCLSLTAVTASALTAMIGFGGGVILVVVMLVFMPPVVALPMHGAVALVANSARLVLFRRHISWRLWWRFVLLLGPGAAAGLWLFQGLSEEGIKTLIGVFVLTTLLMRQSRFFSNYQFPEWSFIPLGFFIGVLAMTVGAIGILFSAFLIRDELNKEAINGTLASFAAMGHLVKIVGFALVGFSFTEHWPIFLAMAPAVILGTMLGRWVHGHFSDRVFLLVFKTVLTLLALRLILWEGLLKAFWS